MLTVLGPGTMYPGKIPKVVLEDVDGHRYLVTPKNVNAYITISVIVDYLMWRF